MKYLFLFLILAVSVTAIPYDLVDLKINISMTNDNGTTHIRSDCNYDLAINESKNVTCSFQRYIEYRNFSFNLNAPQPIIVNNITLNEKNVTCQAPSIDMNYDRVSEICANMSKDQREQIFRETNSTMQESLESKNNIIFFESFIIAIMSIVILALYIHEKRTHKKKEEIKVEKDEPKPESIGKSKYDDFLK